MKNLDIYQTEKAIQAFKKLPFNQAQRKSFIEIMGVSHLEKVSSNTLAFFMDTQEDHKLSDLVISSLFEIIEDVIPYQIYTEKVILEKKSEQGFIDLWIETNDHIIVIENKIHHHTNSNPFDDYIAHAKDNNPDNKKLIFILLVIKSPTSIPDGFIEIKHFELHKNILKKLGEKTLQADQYYLTYLIDYIAAIEKFNPHSEYSKMQIEIVNFYRNHREILKAMEDEDNKKSVYQYYEKKVRDIVELLNIQGLNIISDDAEYCKSETSLSLIGGSLNSKTFISANNEEKIEFEIYTSTGYTTLWCRRLKGKKMTKQDSIALQHFLKSEKIPFIDQDFYNDVLLLEENECISPHDFAEKATPVIKKILSKCGVRDF